MPWDQNKEKREDTAGDDGKKTATAPKGKGQGNSKRKRGRRGGRGQGRGPRLSSAQAFAANEAGNGRPAPLLSFASPSGTDRRFKESMAVQALAPSPPRGVVESSVLLPCDKEGIRKHPKEGWIQRARQQQEKRGGEHAREEEEGKEGLPPQYRERGTPTSTVLVGEPSLMEEGRLPLRAGTDAAGGGGGGRGEEGGGRGGGGGGRGSGPGGWRDQKGRYREQGGLVDHVAIKGGKGLGHSGMDAAGVAEGREEGTRGERGPGCTSGYGTAMPSLSVPPRVYRPSVSSSSSASDISPLTSMKAEALSGPRQLVLLLLISVLPFGGHFVKNCLTSLEVYMVNDARLHLSETRYGLLLSMSSLPNFFIPFLGGVFLDKRGHRFATLLFLFLVLLGQCLFTVAIQLGSYPWALVGRVVMGLGEGSVVVAQRAVICHVFKAQSQVTFAVGVSVAMACLSKTLSRATVVPAADLLGGYVGGLWYTVVVCLLSTLAGVLFLVISDESKEDPFERRRSRSQAGGGSGWGGNGLRDPYMGRSVDPSCGGSGGGTGGGAGAGRADLSPGSLVVHPGMGEGGLLAPSSSLSAVSHTPTYQSMLALRRTAVSLSASFWALAFLHSVYINVFHIFLNFSSHYFTVVFGRDAKSAAFLTSSASVLVIFLGPLVGYIMDKMGGQLYVCTASAALVLYAYVSLSFDPALDPLYDMVLLSIGESFIPILVMALIPFTVPRRAYGTAYGVMEVSGALCSFAGNVLIGYLIDQGRREGNEYTNEYEVPMLALTGLAGLGLLAFLGLTLFEFCCGHKGLNTRTAIDYESLAGLDE
ncbi:hypothetical protein NSK_003712 [Nannochloropsis salina CCMP1776]|uniref:Lysosomal dipeptide transporter MFSD1 n=1 Tax=Nannochloropsis salina CCMP1776 TaxID=1027361 RepID=A0A4D9D9N7_9STRA|nr:hypothetical protein NSK_003712 [Nannochloropsis salina CCMP1776]|eukprot:TFJ85289.1 hypothetical protein NSK_003712 [Nannochloropsis salina CCMP1776]